MTAKIIKLDDYLAEIISLNKPSILKSIMNDMGVDEETAKALEREMNHAQQLQMVDAHLNDNLSDEQKLAVTHAILDPIMATKFNKPFGGADIAEGFNYRREVTNEVARNNIMDWLEERSIPYLIDSRGNFAVKCPDRKTQYVVNRQFEHFLNKWDRGPVGKDVDPTTPRKGLSQIIDISHLLNDTLNEKDINEAAQDASMPLPDLSGTAPMFPAKGNKNLLNGRPNQFENNEAGAMKVLGDLMNPSSTPHIEKLNEDGSEWIVNDDTTEHSYIVNTEKGKFEEVEYVCEGGGPTYGKGHAPGRLGPRPEDPRGAEHDLPTKFDIGGVEVPADPVAERSKERVKKFLQIPFDDLMTADTDDEKIALMRKYNIVSSEVPVKFMGNFLKQFDSVREKIKEIKARGGTPGVKEGKHLSAKQRIKKAKEKLATQRPGSGAAGSMAQATFKKKAGAHDELKYNRKEKHKKPIAIDEGILGTAITPMQTLSINRLRQLAGLPASTMMTIEEVPVKKEEKREPIVQSGKELNDMQEAMDYLSEVFNIYKKLGSAEKQELRYELINTIMADGTRLSESIMDLLLDNKPLLLLEVDGNVRELTEEDKEYLKLVIHDIKEQMLEDIENIDNPETEMSLARIAIVLETLEQEVNNKE